MSKAQTRFGANIAWAIITRWGSKLIGMINMVVLARILAPEDFGIVAMATLVMALLDSMTQVGVHLYVIRQKEDDVRVFNTGWTVCLLQALVIAIALVISAPFVAEFFGESALTNIIYCLAIIKVFRGLQNFGVHIAQKQLDFKLGFTLTLATRFTYMVTTIGFAIWLKNYWAIIIGQAFAVIVTLFLSYKLHEFRPKFQLYQWRKLAKFSLSTIPLSIGRFVNNQSDVAIVGRVGTTAFLGQYNIASNLAQLFTKELMMPIIKGIIPNLSKLKDTPELNSTLRMIIALAVYAFLPLGVGLALVSVNLVDVMLGEQWHTIVPILAWLSIYAMISGLSMFVSEQFLVVFELERLSNRLMWFRNIILLVCIGIAIEFYSVEQLPQAIVVSAALTFPVTLYFVSRSMKLPLIYIIAPWWPAIIGVLSMTTGLYWLQLETLPSIVALIIEIALGAGCYLGTILILFSLRRKPSNTPESFVIQHAMKKLGFNN